jgi:NAD(P)-dependent dehydrogenase (short-subunit alcohol dehydrogenase family)
MTGILQDKIAIITGSTSGIGAGIALAFAREGAKVVINGRRRERGEAVVQSIREQGGEALFVQGDLSQVEDCQRLSHETQKTFGGLDILVNNIGIFPRRDLEKTDAEFWDHLYDVNVRSAFLCAQSAAPLMRERGGGSIINIGSGHAFNTHPNRLFAYANTKSALYAMTMQLAGHLAKDRIRANWITVGWVLTEKEFEIQAGEGHDREWIAECEDKLPMGQYNTVEDMAAGCLYLASDAAARVTGSNINISAGMSIYI